MRPILPQQLRIWLGTAALLSGAVLAFTGGAHRLEAARQNKVIAALEAGHDVAVSQNGTPLLQLARGRYLIAHGLLDGAQAIADRMAASERAGGKEAGPRAELLYALGNAHMRQGLNSFKTMPYRQVAPILSLAKAEFRQVLQSDSGNWDARYNYALAAALVRDTETAAPSIGDVMAHERATWPDIPGAPNGMP